MESFEKSVKDKYEVDLSKYKEFKKPELNSDTHLNDVFFIENQVTHNRYVAKSSSFKYTSDTQKSFVRELKILIYVKHPTIVEFEGFSYKDINDRNNITIITKYMENGSLQDFINRMNNKNLPKDYNNTNIQIILVGIAFGMMILHHYHVIHRDIKPGNILLDDNYYPLISDFGTSKILFNEIPTVQTFVGIGTMFYLSPEILLEMPYNTKTDVYSFSILMYELLMGHSAYPEYACKKVLNFLEYNELCKKITGSIRPKIEEEFRKSFPGLTAIIEACWDKDMNNRPTFWEIFKKLSLLSKNDINKYEEQFPFLANDENLLSDDLFYGYKNVDTQKLHSYIDTMFNAIKPSITIEFDEKFYMTKEIFKQIFILYSNNKITEEDISGEYKDFLKNLSVFFPTDVDIILSDISIGSYKLIIECFVFESFNNNLDEISKHDDFFTNEHYLKTVSYYAFFASISTSLKILKKQEFTFTSLLPALNRITKTNTIYSNIAYLCFIDLIYMAIENDVVVNFDIVLREMIDFFTNNNMGALEHSNKLLFLIANKYIKKTEDLDDEAISIINLYSMILVKNPNIIIEESACSIMELVESFIYKFEDNCLTLLLIFSKFIKKESSKSFLKANFIAQFINTILNGHNKSQYITLKIINPKNMKKNHPPLDLYQIKKIDEKTILPDQDFSNLIDDKMKHIVSIFKEIITLDIEFSIYFVSETVNIIQYLKHHKIVKYGNCPIISHLILCAIEKFPNIAVYNEVKYPFFYNFVFGPHLLSKIIEHLAQINFTEDSIYEILIYLIAKFRIDSEISNLTENDILFLKIRKTCLDYLNSLPITSKYFNSKESIDNYCILLMEPPIRCQIINNLLHYLKLLKIDENQSNYLNYLLKRILCLLKICSHEMPQQEAIEFLISVVKHLYIANLYNFNLTTEYKSIISTICNISKNINCKEETTDLFIYILDFLFMHFPQNKIDFSPFELSINHFFQNIEQIKIIEKFVKILASYSNQKLDPHFEIINPIFLCSFVNIFLTTNQACNVLRFISTLCSYSKSNCIKCHECGLDLLIIDILSKLQKNICILTPNENQNYSFKSFDDEIIYIEKTESGLKINSYLINLLLYLFNQIATTVSSVTVFHQFFSLLRPFHFNNLLCLSLIHINIIYTLNNILSISKFYPDASLHMSSFPISISNIPSNGFKDGMSIVFWINQENLNNKTPYTIFNFKERKTELLFYKKKTQSLVIQLIQSNLQVIIKLDEDYKKYELDINIPNNIWTMITITLQQVSEKPNKSTLSYYLNNTNIHSQEIDTLFSPINYVECIINDQESDIPKVFIDNNLLGNFMLSKPLTEKEISILSSKGQKSSEIPFNEKIIFAYKPYSLNEKLYFLTLYQVGDISISYPQIIYKKIFPFIDILLDNNNLEMIIPLFQQTDIILRDGRNAVILRDISVSFLLSLFQMGDNVQRLFYDSKYFYAIANCLQQTSEKFITAGLYMIYYSLLEKISYNDLRIQLIDSILMNFKLWSKCGINEKEQIFKNWDIYLYADFNQIINSIRSFEWFLFNIQDCYDESNDEKYSQCRKYLFSIAFKILKNRPSSELILLVISLVVHQPLIFMKKEMFDFLCLLSESDLFKSIDCSEIVNLYHAILLRNDTDEEMIYKIISLFVSNYKTPGIILQVPLYKQINYITKYFITDEKKFFSVETFKKLIILMNNKQAIELLPILCINTIKGGSEYFHILESEIKKGINYYINGESTIYSVLLIFKFFKDKNIYHESIKLNISLYWNNLLELINTIYCIEIIGFTPKNIDEIKHDIFCDLFIILNNEKIQTNEIDSMINIVTIVYDFIYFKSSEVQPLSSLFSDINSKDDKSIFVPFEQFGSNEYDINALKNLNLLFEIQNHSFNLKIETFKYQVNMRIKDNKWLDIDLAKKIFTFYLSNQILQLKSCINNMASCIYKYDPKYILIKKSKLNSDLNFKIEDFDISNINKRHELNKHGVIFKEISNFLTAIINSFDSFKLNDITHLLDVFKKYKLDNKNNVKKIDNIIQNTYIDIMNSLMYNRTAWFNLELPHNKIEFKRNNLLCKYRIPSNLCKKTPKFSNKMTINSFTIEDKSNQFIKCKIIKIDSSKEALIKYNKDSIKFIYDYKTKDILLEGTYIFPIKPLKLQMHQIKTGSYYDLFLDESNSAKFNELISHVKLVESIEEPTRLWEKYQYTNFQYLIALNIISGRNFNEANNYPIFPWIFSDYTSETLDIKSPAVYRDFSKIIGTNITDSCEYQVYFWLSRIEPFKTKFNEKKETNQNIFKSIVESYNKATTELIPEFFYLPEFLKSNEMNDVELPPWANHSAFEFVYLHRKALESEYVSSHINEWIDLIWGEQQNKDNIMYKKLFKNLHQKRNPFIRNHSSQIPSKINNCIIKFKEISTISCCDVDYNSTIQCMNFTLIDKSGNIYFYKFNLASFKNKFHFIECFKKINHSVNKKEKCDISSPKFINSEQFCYIDRNDNSVKVVNCKKGSIEKIIKKSSEIILVETNLHDCLAISAKDNSISIHDINLLPFIKQSSGPFSLLQHLSPNQDNYSDSGKIYSFQGQIDCIAINSTFHLLVCGTNDNCLLFCQLYLNKMKINRVVKTDGKPHKIIITNNFGFVVVLLSKIDKKDELVLYSINGEKIRSTFINITAMTQAESSPGKFDYLIIADTKNRIFLFEAFYLKIDKPIFQCKSKIKQLKYIKTESHIIAFCKDGSVSILSPFYLHD